MCGGLRCLWRSGIALRIATGVEESILDSTGDVAALIGLVLGGWVTSPPFAIHAQCHFQIARCGCLGPSSCYFGSALCFDRMR